MNCRWKAFNNVLLLNSEFGVMVALLMNGPNDSKSCKSQRVFCLRFKRRMQDLLASYGSAAEAFGPAWEETLEEVGLEDDEQGPVYRELITWAGDAELFTGANVFAGC